MEEFRSTPECLHYERDRILQLKLELFTSTGRKSQLTSRSHRKLLSDLPNLSWQWLPRSREPHQLVFSRFISRRPNLVPRCLG